MSGVSEIPALLKIAGILLLEAEEWIMVGSQVIDLSIRAPLGLHIWIKITGESGMMMFKMIIEIVMIIKVLIQDRETILGQGVEEAQETRVQIQTGEISMLPM